MVVHTLILHTGLSSRVLGVFSAMWKAEEAQKREEQTKIPDTWLEVRSFVVE